MLITANPFPGKTEPMVAPFSVCSITFESAWVYKSVAEIKQSKSVIVITRAVSAI